MGSVPQVPSSLALFLSSWWLPWNDHDFFPMLLPWCFCLSTELRAEETANHELKFLGYWAKINVCFFKLFYPGIWTQWWKANQHIKLVPWVGLLSWLYHTMWFRSILYWLWGVIWKSLMMWAWEALDYCEESSLNDSDRNSGDQGADTDSKGERKECANEVLCGNRTVFGIGIDIIMLHSGQEFVYILSTPWDFVEIYI